MKTRNSALDYLLNEIKEQNKIILYSNDSVDIYFAKVKIEIANKLIVKYSL